MLRGKDCQYIDNISYTFQNLLSQTKIYQLYLCFSAKYPTETMEKLNMSIDKNPDYEFLSIGGGSDTICLLFKKR